jgi:hypothetical protein
VQDSLDPAHQLVKQAIVVQVDLMNKLVELFLVTSAQINERLNGLIRVCRHFLLLAFFDNLQS